jgi:hypothetical protein
MGLDEKENGKLSLDENKQLEQRRVRRLGREREGHRVRDPHDLPAAQDEGQRHQNHHYRLRICMQQ